MLAREEIPGIQVVVGVGDVGHNVGWADSWAQGIGGQGAGAGVGGGTRAAAADVSAEALASSWPT